MLRQFHDFFPNIDWLTHTGTQFLKGLWFSVMKISSSCELKNPWDEEISIPENRSNGTSYTFYFSCFFGQNSFNILKDFGAYLPVRKVKSAPVRFLFSCSQREPNFDQKSS